MTLQGNGRSGKFSDSAVSVHRPAAPRIHLPFPLGVGIDRLLAQSLHPAQPDQRLLRPSPRHAPGDPGRRQAALMHEMSGPRPSAGRTPASEMGSQMMAASRIAHGGKTLYGARVGILMLETRFRRIP